MRAYDALSRRLHAEARRDGWSQPDAEEICQETYVRLLQRMQRTDLPVIDDVEGYLFTVHRNVRREKIAAAVQSRGMQPIDDPLVEGDLAQTPEYGQMMDDDGLTRMLRAAIEELPEKCRIVAQFHFWGDLSNQEIADTLGISINTVKKHLKVATRHCSDRFPPPG